MSLFFQPGIPQGIHFLDPDESRHAAKVLRLKAGDTLELTDGAGHRYEAQIVEPDFSKCTFRITTTITATRKALWRHIAIAPTKNADRTEWFVEKAVELGIDEISFFSSRNSERKHIQIGRMEKIAVSALKQSQQTWLPKLWDISSLDEMLDRATGQKFIAFVDAANPVHLQHLLQPKGQAMVLIGPEGDFTPAELQQAIHSGFQKVSLGENRLRTETAAMAACHLLNLAGT